jgi:hypothetical protein
MTDPPRISVEGLLVHARKHGVDQVAEVAAMLNGMTEETLTELLVMLDRVNAEHRKDPKTRKLHRIVKVKDPGRRARELLGIPEPETLTKPLPGGRGSAGKVGRKPRKETARGGRGTST